MDHDGFVLLCKLASNPLEDHHWVDNIADVVGLV
jgi:hypothetical protein